MSCKASCLPVANHEKPKTRLYTGVTLIGPLVAPRDWLLEELDCAGAGWNSEDPSKNGVGGFCRARSGPPPKTHKKKNAAMNPKNQRISFIPLEIGNVSVYS